MKPDNLKKGLPIILLGSIFTIGAAQADTNASTDKSVVAPSEAPLELTEVPPILMDSPLNHPAYNLYLLTQGKSVYGQLKTAWRALPDKDLASFKVALDLASETLKKLQSPNSIKAIDKQMAIIRRDLKDIEPKLGDDSWIPVEAMLEDSPVIPTENLTNKSKATAEPVEISANYKLGIFPLTAVSKDIQAARQSLNNKSPDWQGAIKAITHALKSVHWFSKVPAQGLVSAYADTVNAYTLVNAPSFKSEQYQSVIKLLNKAKKEVGKVTDTQELQSEVQALIDNRKPSAADIQDLAGFIKKRIKYQQEQLANQFLDESASEIDNP